MELKRRIEQLLNGIFEYEQPHLVAEPQEIFLTARPGEAAHGSFLLES